MSKLLRYIGRYKGALVVVFRVPGGQLRRLGDEQLSAQAYYQRLYSGRRLRRPAEKCWRCCWDCSCCQGMCSYAYARIMVHISQRTVAPDAAGSVRQIAGPALRYFDTHQSGDLMSRFTNDMDTVSEMINSSFASVVSCALTFIGIVVMMLYMNWVLTLITFAFLVLMLLVVKGVGGRSRVSFQAQQQALGAMNSYIEGRWWGGRRSSRCSTTSKAIARSSPG